MTKDNDPDLCILTDRIREETFPNSKGWYRLGPMLLKMGQYKKAEEVDQILLKQATTEKEKALMYHNIGWTKVKQGEYEEAILYYEKALAIQQQSLPPNHPDLAYIYNGIGSAYENMG